MHEPTQYPEAGIIIHLNIRSLNANFDKLLVFFNQLKQKPLIIFLSEIWDVPCANLYCIPGYQMPEIRFASKGGGVAAYVAEGCHYEIITSVAAIEHISLAVSKGGVQCLSATVVYKRHSQTSWNFLHELDILLETIALKLVPSFVLGDFNINTMAVSNEVTNYITTVKNNGFEHLIKCATRVTDTSQTCIDHVLSNDVSSVAGIYHTTITDHYPVFVVTPLKHRTPRQTIKVTKHDFLTNHEKGCRFAFVLQHKLGAILSTDDVNTAMNKFIAAVQECTNKFSSVKNVYQSKNHKKWINNAIKNAANKRDLLHTLMVRQPGNQEAKSNYLRQRNKVASMIRKSKKEFYADKIDTGGMSSVYKTINEIFGKQNKQSVPSSVQWNGSSISDTTVMAEKFNEVFVSVGPKLASSIPDIELHSNITYNDQSMFLNPVSASEIINIIRGLKNKSPGDDKITAGVLKQFDYIIAPRLSDIINMSFTNGIFPDILKIAKVVPIYKEGSRDNILNYRPISILSALSKVFERVIYNRLYSFMDSFKLFSPNQYGFRAKRSTTHALIEIVEKIRNATNSNKTVSCILLDLRKAFDTLNHRILLRKIENYGIRGQPLSLIKSYLQNRKQYVNVGDICSEHMDIVCGVPQGSILGPLLFLIYVNDVASVCYNSTPYLFADDTNIIGFASKGTADFMQDDVNRVSDWMVQNKLSLNVEKSHSLCINATINHNLACGSETLPNVNYCKYLGVLLDDKLTFDAHIQNVVRKLSRQIWNHSD